MTQTYAFPAPAQPFLPIIGLESVFPVRRIFCIGRNYAEHAKELGVDHYLGKPYAEEELMSLVRHYCSVAEAPLSA